MAKARIEGAAAGTGLAGPAVIGQERTAVWRVASLDLISGDQDLEMDPWRADSIRRVRASIVVPSSRARLGLRSTRV
jgi:hypothetical protein